MTIQTVLEAPVWRKQGGGYSKKRRLMIREGGKFNVFLTVNPNTNIRKGNNQ